MYRSVTGQEIAAKWTLFNDTGEIEGHSTRIVNEDGTIEFNLQTRENGKGDKVLNWEGCPGTTVKFHLCSSPLPCSGRTS